MKISHYHLVKYLLKTFPDEPLEQQEWFDDIRHIFPSDIPIAIGLDIVNKAPIISESINNINNIQYAKYEKRENEKEQKRLSWLERRSIGNKRALALELEKKEKKKLDYKLAQKNIQEEKDIAMQPHYDSLIKDMLQKRDSELQKALSIPKY
jgi:hypothetical protein